MEQRRGLRDNTDVEVRFVALPATIGTGRVTNVSLTGAFMETKCELALTTTIHLEDLEPGQVRGRRGGAQRLAAKVVRRCSAGVGLEWCKQEVQASFESSHTPPPVPSSDESTAPLVYHLVFID